MSALTKIEAKKDTMSLNTRIPTKLNDDLIAINKELKAQNLGVEIVVSKVVIKALEQARRDGLKFLAEHEEKNKEAIKNAVSIATNTVINN